MSFEVLVDDGRRTPDDGQRTIDDGHPIEPEAQAS